MMKATMTLDMNSLWQSIKSLSASNKEWLRDKLIEDLDGGMPELCRKTRWNT